MKDVKVVRYLVFAVAVTFLFSGISTGQVQAQVPTELALFEEIPIVYTPAKKEQLITEAPASTHVITAEDIKLYGGINIYDAIRQVSGVNVMATTVSQPDVTIRGLNEIAVNNTLLLVDGRNIYLPLQGIFLWETIPIQLEEIKQIEVVKGPVASLYGENAFSGLINIITKSPEEINGTIISGKIGTEDTYIGSLVHGQKLDNLGYKVSLGWRRFDFFENDDYKTDLGKLNAELQFDLSDISKLSLSGGLVNGKFPFIGSSTPGFLGDVDGTSTYLKLNYNLGGFEGKFFWNYMDSGYDPLLSDVDAETNSYELELKYNFNLWERHSFTIGGGGRYDVAESNIYPADIDEKNFTRLNIYLQDDFEVTDTLRLVGSARLDHHPIADYNPTGRLAAMYNLAEDHLIRASIGNSFRAPTFTEYFMELTQVTPVLTAITRGNEELDVETIFTSELGYEGWLLEKRLKFNLDIFWSMLEDFIDVVSTGMTSLIPPIAELQYVNQGEATTWGIEPGVEIFFTSWLSGLINYSYQDVDFSDGAYTRLTPRHKVNLGLKARIMEKLIATVYGHYVSEAEERDTDAGSVDSYFLLNARVGYQFNDYIELALAGSNLLNDEHQEAPSGEEIGMRITGDVTIRF